jgi:glycerol-3-phosphate dehydrogenase (NAD(P)+)
MEAIGSVAEGYYAAKAVKQLADREGLYLPIMSAAYDVLYKDVSPKEAVGKLMTLRKMDELGRGSGWFLD